MGDDQLLLIAWGLAALPMAHTSYTQAVLQFLKVDEGVSPRRLSIFELAVEVVCMRGTFDDFVRSWRPRQRRDTAPGHLRALRHAA